MKRLALYSAFVMLLLASLLIPARTAFAATTPTTAAIQNAYGYQHVFEDNDQLYIVQYEFEYALAADTPDWVGAEFLCQFADNTEVFASVQPWGYYGATDTTLEWWYAIYISADDVSAKGITWEGANNKVALAGNPALVWSGAVPYDSTTTIEYSTATTQAETEIELEARFRSLAIYYENISEGANDYIANINGNWKLTEDGEYAFTNTWEPIEIAVPNLFSQGSITPEPAPTIDTDQFTDPLNGTAQIYGVNWVAQTFTPDESYSASGIQIKVYRVGNPNLVTVSLRATTADVPTGGDLASATIDGDDFTTDTDGNWETFSFASLYNFNANSTYAIVVRAIYGDVNNYVRWLGYEIAYTAETWECSPIAEPDTTYNTVNAYNSVTGYIYQVGGDTWPGAVHQWTYAAQYDVSANVWTEIDGLNATGIGPNTTTYMFINRNNGDLFTYDVTDNTFEMYDQTDSTWHTFTVILAGQEAAISVHDTTNNVFHSYNNLANGLDYSHSMAYTGNFTNNGLIGFQFNLGNVWREIIIGTDHYFYRGGYANYIHYDETTETITLIPYGAAWSYDLWAVWYDEDEDTIYGVWNPTTEAMIPPNAHLCTFNLTNDRWTEGDNLGLSAYAGLPNNYDGAQYPWGVFLNGYIYMMGQGNTYATGSPYFKMPVPQLLAGGIEGQRCNSADSGASWTGAPDWDMSFIVMAPGYNVIPDMPGDWDWGGLPDEMGMSNLWFSSLFWLICTFCMMLASMKVLKSNKGVWSIFILMTPLGWYIGFLAMQIAVGIAMICVFAFIYVFFFRPSGV